MAEFELDTSVEQAWRRLRIELGDRLSGLQPGERHTVAQSPEFAGDAQGVLTFTVTRARRVRCTVRVRDLSHDGQFYALEAMGWRPLRDGRLIYEVGKRRADEIALVAVRVLREVLDVLHPAYLDGAPMPSEVAVAIGSVPDSPGHLLRLVRQTFESLAGHPIALDADGDIPLPGEIPSWLHVDTESASIEFATTLVDEVSDVAAAAEYVARESIRWPGIKLVLLESTLGVCQTIHMTTFHRQNLISALGRWCEFIAEHAPSVIEAVTGAAAPDPTGEKLPDALEAILVLDSDGESLDAEEIATICGHDRAEILELIRTGQAQYLEWMASAAQADAEGDTEDAAAHRRQEQAWRATTAKLRAALRIVVLRRDGGRPERDFRWTG